MSSWGTFVGTAIVGTCLAMTLGGCSGLTQPESAPPVPTVTVTSTPSPIPTIDPINCDTAFTADLNAKFAEDGLTFRDDSVSSDNDTMIGTDGLRCRWGIPQTDISVVYQNWSRDAAAWETLKIELLIDGYTETGPFAVSRPLTEYDSACSYRDGIVHCVSPSRFIGWVTALQ